MIGKSASVAAVLSTASLLWGCAVHPGLANAPQLGGTADTDPRVHDVIANGPDSCGRTLDPGPLRNRVIPCPHVSHAPSSNAPFSPVTTSNGIVRPWVEHFYWRWACPSVDHSLLLPSPELGGSPDARWSTKTSQTDALALSSRCPAITSPR